MVIRQHENAAKHGIMLFGFDDSRQGILHIVPPEQGITQPGLLICGADSHTSTHGAFGCIAFGIGASDMTHVMATQATWQRKPEIPAHQGRWQTSASVSRPRTSSSR